ncbi:hypothetical protein Q1695_008731 [Nippostrongylus brasiliensis]|nr:hypothetical protein Q1695_008731 [Nippostrongylus brasiliensis]
MGEEKKDDDDGIFSGVIGSISSMFGAEGEAIARRRRIERICSSFKMTNEKLEQVMTLLEASIEKGLKKEDNKDLGALPMLPTYVRAVPNGEEQGDFLALDLGGTNFRILLISLNGREAEMTGKVYSVPDSIMRGTGDSLFDHIAECMAKFMEDQGIPLTRKLPLGFTFSFPCKQEGLTSAKLIRWTKGFDVSGCKGVDVCQKLKEACGKRSDIDIDLVALLNDTVGTLMACAFRENTCLIGVIIGTGTNACYMESLDKIPKLQSLVDDGMPDEIVMNCEWGAFGDDGSLSFIYTRFDREVDKESINPGKQIFEKMIAGMYLGEVARIVLMQLAQEGLILSGQIAPLQTKGSDLMGDDEKTYPNTARILMELGVRRPTKLDCANVAYVCSIITERAAHLLAAGIATLINRMQRPLVTVGIDGSVYRFHPRFPQWLDDKIAELIEDNLRYKLMLSEDGSGIGAAVVAAVATRMKQQNEEGQHENDEND